MADPADRVYFRLLVIRCQAGDPAAFEELVARCHTGLRAFLHKMLNNQHNVDDVAQDVWLEAYRNLKKLNDPGAFRAWLYRAARNRAFLLLRRHRTIEFIEGVEPVAGEEEPDFTVADAEAVHTALDQLGPEHREVLLLRFMQELSYEEIAAVVGCQIGTVRSRIHNAKRQMRILMQNRRGQP